jgi:hypothetical protein
MKIKLLNLISIFGFLTVLKLWIKELNLIIEAKKVLLNTEGWFTKEHLDAAFGLLYHDIFKYAGFQEHVARLDKAKHAAHVNRPCLQFYHIDQPRHWFLLYFFPCNESHYQCYVYDTLGFHDLDFGLLQNIGISPNIRIPPISIRRWIILWPTCCSYGHKHSLPIKSRGGCIQHGRN